MTILDRLPQVLGSHRHEPAHPSGPQPTGSVPTPVGAFAPAVDVEERDDAYVLHVELPDVDPDDVEVCLDGDVLTIAGERHFYDEQETDRFRRVERHFGRFHRAVRLPDGSDADGVEATYREGLLTIDVPKQQRARPRRITVDQTG